MPTKKAVQKESQKPTWAGSVFVWPTRILFTGEAAISEVHSTHAVLICLAVGGTFKLKSIDNTRHELKSYSGAILDAGVKHCMDGLSAKSVILLYLLPETEEAREIKRRYLSKHKIRELPATLVNELLSGFGKRDWWFLRCEKASTACDGIMGRLIGTPSTSLSRKVNYHVRRTINYLYSEIDTQLSKSKFDKKVFEPSNILKKLEIFWTKDRFEREFREGTGISFDEYVNILKLRAALERLAVLQQNRESLTDITLTGIAKSLGMKISNFSYMFKHMLGINPRVLRDDSRFWLCDNTNS